LDVVFTVQSSRRRLELILAGAIALFSAGHVAVLAAWHHAVLPDLARAPRAARLSAAFARFPPRASDAWPSVDLPKFGMRLRLPAASANGTQPCEEGCWIPLMPGRLRVEAQPRVESYWETVQLLAPDRGDASFRRAPWRNWATMLALSRRVLEDPVVPGAWRFEANEARGVVTTHANHAILRHVVYAYSREGRAAPPLLFTRTPTDIVIRILGSLEFP